MVKFLRREDFKHSVKLSYPHDGAAVRGWCHKQGIAFVFSADPEYVDYIMADEKAQYCLL